MSMTRQEQLDAVVRNYGEWDERCNVAYWSGGKVRLAFQQCGPGSLKEVIGTLPPSFTRAEVEQRKAELQNKPSWDDAPEGANILVYAPAVASWVFGSYKDANKDEYSLDWRGVGKGSWFLSKKHFCEAIGDWRDTLEKRPEPEASPEEEEAFNMLEARNGECIGGSTAEWDGEGLPPIGAECYVQLAFNDMGKCRITYIGDGVFCYRQNSSGNEYTGSVRDTVFRPIKSDREKWVEAAMNGLSYAADESPEDMIGMIHDAMASGQLPVPELKS